MRRNLLFALPAIALIGCGREPLLTYVDLDKVERPPMDIRPSVAAGTPSEPPLPAEEAILPALRGAELALNETRDRLDEAREQIRQNQASAERSLANALYRAYSREAEVARTESDRELSVRAENSWTAVFREISAELQGHASRRFPTAVRLAFLVGYPFSNPETGPRPETPRRLRRYDEAVNAWKKLLAEDADFEAKVTALLKELEAKLAQERVDIQIQFARKLNDFADQARKEAEQAVSNNLPDFSGALVPQGDITVRAEPERTVQFEAVTPPAASEPAATATPPSDRKSLENALRIWMAQNGYRRAPSPGIGTDRTKEFADWIKARKAGP